MAPLFFPFSSSPPRSSSSPPPPSLSSPATSSSAVMAADLDQPSQNPLHPPSSADDTDPKPLSETENKSLRAARFGTPLNLSEHEKRQTRAERFGTESKDSEEQKRKRRAESVAPMMDWTDNCFRTLARLISKHAWLYREMVVAETIVHQKENLDKFLEFPSKQHPIVLQIGGCKLENLGKAAELAKIYGYDEINLNCGCPSGKVVGHGCFCARLMLDPTVCCPSSLNYDAIILFH